MLAGWGIGMANELHVDAAGLRTASASSANVAAGLSGPSLASAVPAQPSGVGVGAVNAVLASLGDRQSARIASQADDLSVSSARYETTDTDGRDAVTAVSV